ncbi:hypothetical protein NI437_000008 [Salmonella enterica]|nr:hypothetical protein [Salmonella enterica]
MKRITFNLFKHSETKFNVSILEGKASKHDKSFNVATGKTLTEMRKNAGIKDGAEWQITSRFDKRHVQPTMTDGETVETYIRASKGDEVYYVAIIKGAKGGFRAVMHHKSKRNEYGVAIAETAKRFRTAVTECDVKDSCGTVNKPNGATFNYNSIQITSSFFCKKETKKEVAVVEEVQEVVAVEEVVETAKEKELKEELAAAYAKIAELEAALTKKEEVKEVAVVEEIASVPSIEEELEELLAYRWGNGEVVEETVEEIKEEVKETVTEEIEVETKFDFVKARDAFLKNNRVTVEDEEEEEESVEYTVDEEEFRRDCEMLHDGMYGTNYSAFAYAA